MPQILDVKQAIMKPKKKKLQPVASALLKTAGNPAGAFGSAAKGLVFPKNLQDIPSPANLKQYSPLPTPAQTAMPVSPAQQAAARQGNKHEFYDAEKQEYHITFGDNLKTYIVPKSEYAAFESRPEIQAIRAKGRAAQAEVTAQEQAAQEAEAKTTAFNESQTAAMPHLQQLGQVGELAQKPSDVNYPGAISQAATAAGLAALPGLAMSATGIGAPLGLPLAAISASTAFGTAFIAKVGLSGKKTTQTTNQDFTSSKANMDVITKAVAEHKWNPADGDPVEEWNKQYEDILEDEALFKKMSQNDLFSIQTGAGAGLRDIDKWKEEQQNLARNALASAIINSNYYGV
jgi:hypothetical protein